VPIGLFGIKLAFWLKLWKSSEDYGFLKTVHSQPLQQTLKNLEKTFKDGFDKKQPLKRIPKFKKKGLSDRFRYPQGVKVDQVGDVKNMTISRKGKHWYCSIQTEYESELKRHESTSMVGVDMGITRFATLSDGSYVEPLNSFRKLSEKLAKSPFLC